MSFNIIPTPPFEKEIKQLAKKYPSIKKDFSQLLSQLMQDPRSGTSLGNNCYKLRMAISSKGRGKSGGARIITFVQIIEKTVFLIAIYDKSETGSISDAALKERLKNIK